MHLVKSLVWGATFDYMIAPELLSIFGSLEMCYDVASVNHFQSPKGLTIFLYQIIFILKHSRVPPLLTSWKKENIMA